MMIPGIREAQRVESTIKRLGVQDVKLMFDPISSLWGVYQVQRSYDDFILPRNYPELQPYLLWWCKGAEDEFRPPTGGDVANVMTVVRRAQHWFRQGGDALADELDKQDVSRRVAKEQRHKERLAPHMKTLKRAIREEMG